MALSLTIAGGSVSLSGWPVVAALVAVAWVGELAAQGWAMRDGGRP